MRFNKSPFKHPRSVPMFTHIIVALFAAAPAPAQTDAPPPVQSDLDAAAELVQSNRPREALQRLDTVESREPDNPWVWFYRGLAHLEIGNWYTSMESLDRAQDLLSAHGDPDPNLAEAIRRYRGKARNQVFGVTLNLGLAYDSNVTFLGSGGAGLDLAGRGDGKFTSRLQFAYAPIATEAETLTVGVRIVDSWHFAIEEFDDQDYGATFRYVRALNDRWSAAIQYDYDITYLGNEPFSSAHAITPSLIYTWPGMSESLRPTESTLTYRIEGRDFLFDTDPRFDRDGYTNAISLEQKFALRPIVDSHWTWDIAAGYSLDSVATEGREFDRLDHTFYLDVAVPLTNPWLPQKDLTFRFNANWQIADYRNDSLLDGDADERSDFLTTLTAVISQKLVTVAERGDLTVHGIVGWSDANSNVTTTAGASPFTYDKWIAGVQLEWSF